MANMKIKFFSEMDEDMLIHMNRIQRSIDKIVNHICEHQTLRK